MNTIQISWRAEDKYAKVWKSHAIEIKWYGLGERSLCGFYPKAGWQPDEAKTTRCGRCDRLLVDKQHTVV